MGRALHVCGICNSIHYNAHEELSLGGARVANTILVGPDYRGTEGDTPTPMTVSIA